MSAKIDKLLKEYGWAPGRYRCKCVSCGGMFDGQRRGHTCKFCAVTAAFEGLVKKYKL